MKFTYTNFAGVSISFRRTEDGSLKVSILGRDGVEATTHIWNEDLQVVLPLIQSVFTGVPATPMGTLEFSSVPTSGERAEDQFVSQLLKIRDKVVEGKK